MDLRSCGSTHFIQAVVDGLVIKVPNMNSHGKPALLFKSLKDIYESEDAKTQDRPTSNSLGAHGDSMSDKDLVKSELGFIPVVKRRLQETKPATDEFIPGEADDGMGSELDDNITLGQIKKRSNTKKRKRECSADVKQIKDQVNPEVVEDDSDLMKPLIAWKSKLSKSSKGKSRGKNRSDITSSGTSISVKSEYDLDSDGSMTASLELLPSFCVEPEIPEPEILEGQSIRFTNDLSISHGEEHGTVVSSETLEMVEFENREPMLPCSSNEASYEHLEDVKPILALSSIDEKAVELGNPEISCKENLALEREIEATEEGVFYRSSPDKDQSSDMYNDCRSSSNSQEILGKCGNSFGAEAPGMATDIDIASVESSHGVDLCLFKDEAEVGHSSEMDCSTSSPLKNYSSSWEHNDCSKTEDSIVPIREKISNNEKLLAPNADPIARHDLTFGYTHEVELSMVNSKSATKDPSIVRERNFSAENHPCDVDNTFLTPGPCHPPERLPSKRKAISPSSQEKLCLALNSVKSCENSYQLECKEKLRFGEQTENKAQTDIGCSKVAKRQGNHAPIIRRKVMISPGQMLKKSQECKHYLAKGNLEGPRFSRSLPKVSSECISIKGCSESAIMFSQQQMHDVESLAGKLMNELKSMKDIVEQKLLFESYRKVSLRNDADEVKSAICNAAKVEETAKKVLSMMSRDCTRFCKIMRLTQNDASTTKKVVPSERKKVRFADEAGLELCDVKLFEDCMNSSISNGENQ